MEFGLLLPHFGRHGDARRTIEGAVRAEALGFHSVWVRDHLFLPVPPGGASTDAAFLEGLTMLTAIGVSTGRVRLGTAALVPIRHPLQAALVASTMTHVVGPRLILGIGRGSTSREFDALGLGGVDRLELLMTGVDIMRRAWSGEPFSWSDAFFSFEDVAIQPPPIGGSIPFWYCGNTPRSARLAAERLEGWLPGRISLATLRARVATLREVAEGLGRPMPAVGIVPATTVAARREDALAGIDLSGLFKTANGARFWVKPPSGEFSTIEDLEGLLLWGSPQDIVRQVRKLEAAGVGHVVFDCRLDFSRFEEQMELLGHEVLPSFA